MGRVVFILVLGAVFAAVGRTQDLPGRESLLVQLEKEGIELDLDAQQIRVRGAFKRAHSSPEYPVEYLLVTAEGATHEALILVDCKPSLLNACFLALGLQPGEARRAIPKVPQPAEEDVADGLEIPYEVLPPRGARVFLALCWTAADGTPRCFQIEDLILDSRTGAAYPVRGFVYLGSRFAQVLQGTEKREVYIADVEGNVVSLYPDRLAAMNSLLDVFSTASVEYQFADVHDGAVPARGVPVECVFSLSPLPGLRQHQPEQPQEEIAVPAAAVLRQATRNPFLMEAEPSWLGRVGARSFQDLARIVEQARPEIREIAAAMLGTWGHDRAVPPLSDTLRMDRSPEVRLSAAYALAEVGSPLAVTALVETVREGWMGAREDALFALRLLSGEDHGRSSDAWQEWGRWRFSPEGR
jgi:hypothetical protein